MSDQPDVQLPCSPFQEEPAARISRTSHTLPPVLARALTPRPAQQRMVQGSIFGSTDEEPEDLDVGNRITADMLLAAWLSTLESRPHESLIKKQGNAARTICQRHHDEEIIMAWIGMSRLFPYSRGTPFDLFHLRDKFHLAVEAGLKHPKVRMLRAAANPQQRGADALGL